MWLKALLPKIDRLKETAPQEVVPDFLSALKHQYESHPYPDRAWFLRPSRPKAHPLAYELGQYLRTGRFISHAEHKGTEPTRILIAGSGTVEPLVVAELHPNADVVAVDLSENSLKRLQIPALLWGLRRRIRLVQADLHDDLRRDLGQFDYIVCTGVLHHSKHPRDMLASLKRLLKPGGVLRLMTYPRHSRGWVFELQRFFAASGLTAKTQNLAVRCRTLIRALPKAHPLRTTFETYQDARNLPGLIDGFFNACEAPIATKVLRAACDEIGLRLIGFGHPWHSQPNAFIAALKRTNAPKSSVERYLKLDPWRRLGALDEAWELTVNPVYWLTSAEDIEEVSSGDPKRVMLNPAFAEPTGLIQAPLMPTTGDELVATLHGGDLPRWGFAGGVPRKFVEGGLCLGCDGTLPSALLANRCHQTALELKVNITPESRGPDLRAKIPAPRELDWIRLADASTKAALRDFSSSLVTRWNPPGRASQQSPGSAEAKPPARTYLVPSPVRFRMAEDLVLFLAKLGAFELDAHDLDALFRSLGEALESRANRKGKTLPWLSGGDLLRDLTWRFPGEPKTVLAILTHFPAPPYNEQWIGAFGKEKAPRVLTELSTHGALNWFVAIDVV